MTDAALGGRSFEPPAIDPRWLRPGGDRGGRRAARRRDRDPAVSRSDSIGRDAAGGDRRRRARTGSAAARRRRPRRRTPRRAAAAAVAQPRLPPPEPPPVVQAPPRASAARRRGAAAGRPRSPPPPPVAETPPPEPAASAGAGRTRPAEAAAAAAARRAAQGRRSSRPPRLAPKPERARAERRARPNGDPSASREGGRRPARNDFGRSRSSASRRRRAPPRSRPMFRRWPPRSAAACSIRRRRGRAARRAWSASPSPSAPPARSRPSPSPVRPATADLDAAARTLVQSAHFPPPPGGSSPRRDELQLCPPLTTLPAPEGARARLRRGRRRAAMELRLPRLPARLGGRRTREAAHPVEPRRQRRRRALAPAQRLDRSAPADPRDAGACSRGARDAIRRSPPCC